METEKTHTNWVAFFLIIVFVVLLAVLGGYLYLSKGKTTSTTPTTKTTPVSVANVSITKGGFVPATIQVKNGSQVTWTNNDTSPHQVVTDPHPTHTNLKSLDSDSLSQGESFNFTFEKTGTFSYHDEMNPLTIKGIVIVK